MGTASASALRDLALRVEQGLVRDVADPVVRRRPPGGLRKTRDEEDVKGPSGSDSVMCFEER